MYEEKVRMAGKRAATRDSSNETTSDPMEETGGFYEEKVRIAGKRAATRDSSNEASSDPMKETEETKTRATRTATTTTSILVHVISHC